MTTALTTTPLADFRVAILPEAQQAKRDALALAAPITSVGTVLEQQDAIGAASLCKGLLRDVEKAQQDVVAIARKLEEEGVITTGAAAGEAYVV